MKTWDDLGIIIPPGRTGEVYVACPQCSRDRKKKHAKCLSINTDKQVYCCHHCGWSGGLASGNWSQSDPTKYVPKLYTRPAFRFFYAYKSKKSKFFDTRGISQKTLEANQIMYTNIYMPQTEQEELSVAFPYYVGDDLVNAKFRTVEGKYFRFWPGARQVLYGLNHLVGQTIGVIVEGEMDKLALYEAGIPYAVSVPNGAPSLTASNLDTKMAYLEHAEEYLDPLEKIILAVDDDGPGKALQEELSRRLGPDRCFRVTWPEGCKDANQCLMDHGADVLAEVIEHAVELPVQGVVDPSDLTDDVIVLYQQGLKGGLSTGWPSLDLHYTVRPGELTIVTGIPSHGKSSWLDALLVNLATLHDWRLGLFSPEQYPLQRHIAVLVQLYVGKTFRAVEWGIRLSEYELRTALPWVSDHFRFIGAGDDLDDSLLTIDSLLAQTQQLVKRCGIRGVVFDPWNEIEHQRSKECSETEYISRCLTKLRRFARKFGVHIWLVAHPQKLYRQKDGTYPIPTPWDISGSAHWWNKSENCITFWRDIDPESERNDIGQVHVQKVKFREVGKPGMKELKYLHQSGRFVEDADEPGF